MCGGAVLQRDDLYFQTALGCKVTLTKHQHETGITFGLDNPVLPGPELLLGTDRYCRRRQQETRKELARKSSGEPPALGDYDRGLKLSDHHIAEPSALNYVPELFLCNRPASDTTIAGIVRGPVVWNALLQWHSRALKPARSTCRYKSRRACLHSTLSGYPTRQYPRQRSACARLSLHQVSRFPRDKSRSISRPPISRKKAVITTFQ